MYKRRDIDTSSFSQQEIIENGSPVVILGTVSCSLNGIHAYYQDMAALHIETPRLTSPIFQISFRGGTVLKFKGPRFPSPGRKRFISEVQRLKNNILQLARDHWRNLLVNHFSKQRPFSIDNFRFMPNGDIYDDQKFITSVLTPGFRCEASSGALYCGSTSTDNPNGSLYAFDVGMFPDILVAFLNEMHASGPANSHQEWSGIEETASRAIVLLAALAGAWNMNGLEQKLRNFAAIRHIDYDRVSVDLINLDYLKLALDKRLMRRLYNAVAEFCSDSRRAARFRFDDLVHDLVKVAADGIRLSDVSVYVIYEIALFQGFTMGHVPKMIGNSLSLNGTAWQEVRIMNGGNFSWPEDGLKDVKDNQESSAQSRDRNASRNMHSDDEREQSSQNFNSFSRITGRSLSVMTKQYLLFFGFEVIPDEKSFKQAYRKLLKAHHPDQLPLSASDDQRSHAKAIAQEINSKKDWIISDLAEFWLRSSSQ